MTNVLQQINTFVFVLLSLKNLKPIFCENDIAHSQRRAATYSARATCEANNFESFVYWTMKGEHLIAEKKKKENTSSDLAQEND
jgi:hypothetical protein